MTFTTIKVYSDAIDALERLLPNCGLKGAGFDKVYYLAGCIALGSEATDAEFAALVTYRKDYDACAALAVTK